MGFLQSLAFYRYPDMFFWTSPLLSLARPQSQGDCYVVMPHLFARPSVRPSARLICYLEGHNPLAGGLLILPTEQTHTEQSVFINRPLPDTVGDEGVMASSRPSSLRPAILQNRPYVCLHFRFQRISRKIMRGFIS